MLAITMPLCTRVADAGNATLSDGRVLSDRRLIYNLDRLERPVYRSKTAISGWRGGHVQIPVRPGLQRSRPVHHPPLPLTANSILARLLAEKRRPLTHLENLAEGLHAALDESLEKAGLASARRIERTSRRGSHRSTFATVRSRSRVAKGPGSRAAGLAMAFKLIGAWEARWRAVNAPHLVALVRAGSGVREGQTHRTTGRFSRQLRRGPHDARPSTRI